jgi:hypothetical protein
MPDQLKLTVEHILLKDNRLNIDEILGDHSLLSTMTGFESERFHALCEKFGKQLELETQGKKTKAGAIRQRKAGAGRRSSLMEVRAKLFFLLFYYKFHPTFELAGTLFGVDHSRPVRWLKEWQPVLQQVSTKKLRERKNKLSHISEFRQVCQDILSE